MEELLAKLTPQEREQALEAAAIAKRAEERAEKRALEQAMARKLAERKSQTTTTSSNGLPPGTVPPRSKVKYIPKHKRQQVLKCSATEAATVGRDVQPKEAIGSAQQRPKGADRHSQSATAPNLPQDSVSLLSDAERIAVKTSYLGKSWQSKEEKTSEKEKRRKKKQTGGTKRFSTFRFQWDESDDTFKDDDPLYANLSAPETIIQGKQQSKKRQRLQRLIGTAEDLNFDTVATKPISSMTPRDWNIFRENFEISVKGGSCPPPMRSFRESPSPKLPTLHAALLDAIENVMGFQDPSPIQRQAIPIGLQRRDLIGIAETGSGKTVAFGVPLCNYLLNLPSAVLQSVADQGPLALVMAPTRELAQQINVEIQRLLSRQSSVRSICVTGGPPIQQQAQQIRHGVHIIVGTPGRINECIEMTYLVLNQCSYMVMDEVGCCCCCCCCVRGLKCSCAVESYILTHSLFTGGSNGRYGFLAANGGHVSIFLFSSCVVGFGSFFSVVFADWMQWAVP